MTETGAVWVGEYGLEAHNELVPISSPDCSSYASARILVRTHGAPIGYVDVPVHPVDTLGDRVKVAAETECRAELDAHRDADNMIDAASETGSWAARVRCPLRLPKLAGDGFTIVVCTRDRPEMLRECLLALCATKYEPLEILVVDNASSNEATRRVVGEVSQNDPRVRYTSEPTAGLSRARNHGLAAAKFELVAFTDDDILVGPGWADAMAAGFAADPAAVCVTGPVSPHSLDTASQRYFASRYKWDKAFTPRRYDLTEHRLNSALYPFKAGIFGTGANFAVRRSSVRAVGGFDPVLGAGAPGRGGEDLDIFFRLILSGGRICYVPSALVWHKHRHYDSDLAKHLYDYGYGLGAYIAKRLLTREMSLAVLGRSFAESIVMGRQIRQASHAGHYGTLGWLLGVREAYGAVAGLFGYWHAERKLQPSAPTFPQGQRGMP